MESTPIFFHGREGTNQGRKARWLGREYGACTPSYETNYLSSAMPVARQVLKEHQPTAIVGSSFGGAVLLNLIQEGLWKGPSVFLAQAGIKFGLPVELPPDVPAVFIHGTRDDIVSIDDSRALAECGGMSLIEVDDDHRLGSIRESGVLGDALTSLGVKPLLSPDVWPFGSESRTESLDWLEAFISMDTPIEERRALIGHDRVGRLMKNALVAALRGLWRNPNTEDDLRARLCIFELAHPPSSLIAQAPYGLEVRAVDEKGDLHMGKIKTTYGTSLYDFHYEWPIDGTGVRKDLIEVFPPDGGPPQPILEWLRKEGRIIMCYHCGGILSDRVELQGCAGRGL